MAYEVRREGYLISTDKSILDIDAIHSFLSRSYWAAGIPRETLVAAIEHSLPFGLYHEGRQVGFARVVSDCATFAYLMDVYIEEPYRGRGLGKLLMESVVQHPRLQGLRRWMLGTRDAHGLYEQFGFTPLGAPERWMELADPGVYQTPDSKRKADSRHG